MAGNDPIVDALLLTRGADFVNTWHIADTDPNIPAGTTARIEFTESDDTDADIIATWASTSFTVGERDITCRVESDDSGDDLDLVDGLFWRLIVTIPDTPENLDHCWYRGKTKRKQ